MLIGLLYYQTTPVQTACELQAMIGEQKKIRFYTLAPCSAANQINPHDIPLHLSIYSFVSSHFISTAK